MDKSESTKSTYFTQERLEQECSNAERQLVEYKEALDQLHKMITECNEWDLPTKINRVANLGLTLEELKIDLMDSYMPKSE